MINADHIVRGTTKGDRFSVAAMRGSEIVGAISINAAKGHGDVPPAGWPGNHGSTGSDVESTAYDLRQALKIN